MKTVAKAKTNKAKLEDKILAVCTWIGKARRVIRRFKRKHWELYYLAIIGLSLLIGLPIIRKLAEAGIIVFY